MRLDEALRTIWVGIDDLESLASTLEPQDQLDEEEVALGSTNRGDRYDFAGANEALNGALRTSFELAAAAEELLEAFDNGALPRGLRMERLRARLGSLRDVFGVWKPEAASSHDCPGCPCVEQGGSPCCFCGASSEAHVR